MQADANFDSGVGTAELLYEGAIHTGSARLRSFPAFTSPAEQTSYLFWKRSLELLLIALAAPVLLPIFIVLSLAVVITSPGPVFFSHRRIGQGGSFFSMWKFRTMCANSAEVLDQHLRGNAAARAEWRETHKLRDDPRVTPLGRVLRKYSLDELPQIWNVVTGKMSLVGPRPIVAAEAEKYAADFPYYLAVRPGITGLWQTSGRSKLTYDERVALDRVYVERWSLLMDLKILVRTIGKVANSDGAF